MKKKMVRFFPRFSAYVFWALIWACLPAFSALAQEELGADSEGSTSSNSTQTEKVSGFSPSVKIMGQQVMSNEARLQKDIQEKLPKVLNNDAFLRLLGHREEVAFHEHSPQQGSPKAPITIIELVDLNCGECAETLRRLDAIRKKFPGKIRIIHIHVPYDLFTTTNPAAFYGKLAQKAGVFWQYREKIVQLEEPSENVYLNILLDLGVSRQQMRDIIRSETRKFYRELDADTALGQKINVTQPPVLFVNGIRVQEKTLLEHIEPIIQYELDVIELKRRG